MVLRLADNENDLEIQRNPSLERRDRTATFLGSEELKSRTPHYCQVAISAKHNTDGIAASDDP
jgi:hypothetical protein